MTGLFESDVPRETKVLLDQYLNSDQVSIKHRILFFDIEVDSVGGFATVQEADKSITAITCYYQSEDKYIVFLLDKEEQIVNKETTIGNETVLTFATEEELLQTFLAAWKQYAPTIISTWNGDFYDIPMLYNRLVNVFDKPTANQLSPVGLVRWSKSRERYQIAGVSSLDYLPLYKKFALSQRPNYRLDTIGQLEVNMGKIAYEGRLDDLTPEQMIAYNLQDVKIVVALDAKLQYISLVMAISHMGHTQYEDYPYSSKYIEGTILTYLHRQNRVAPNKSAEGREEFQKQLDGDTKGFVGAYVRPPMPGLYEWVYSLDLTSLYPSVMRSLNISKETKMAIVHNFNPEQHARKDIVNYQVQVFGEDAIVPMNHTEFIAKMTEWNSVISSNGIIYSTARRGVFPEVLDSWFADRVTYKQKMKEANKAGDTALGAYYDTRQYAYKILLNSAYGYAGLPIGRFYDVHNSEAVTLTGQSIIKLSAKYVNSIYAERGVANKTNAEVERYEQLLREHDTSEEEIAYCTDAKNHCIYIDTDSVYFSAKPLFKDGDDPLAVTIDLAHHMEERLNKFYDAMAKNFFHCNAHEFSIKGESVCETALWVVKKRYAMQKVYNLEESIAVNPPKMEIKGLDIVRSQFAPAFRDMTSGVLKQILQKAPQATIDALVLDFREKVISLSWEEIAKNTAVKNIEMHDAKSEKGFEKFPKGCAAHVKASIVYNRWLRMKKLDKVYAPIRNGDKVRFFPLKQNPLRIQMMALKGFDDPPELVQYANEYLDHVDVYNRELRNKLQEFYFAMSWGLLPTSVNRNAAKFFSF